MCVSKTYENNDVKKTIVDTKFNMENDDSDDEVDASLMSSELFCEMSKMSSLDFLLLLFSLSSICCIHIYTTVNGDSIRFRKPYVGSLGCFGFLKSFWKRRSECVRERERERERFSPKREI